MPIAEVGDTRSNPLEKTDEILVGGTESETKRRWERDF